MNAAHRFAVKTCLLAAASGALFNPTVSLLADDVDPPPARMSVPRIQQTAGVQGATAAAPPSAASDGTSEVQKQLREIYRKNGREMPSMNLDDLPNTQAPVPSATAPVQVAPNGPVVAPNRPPVKPGKPNWFERTFHVGRGKKQPPPDVAQPARPAASAMQQPQSRYATMQPAPRPAAPVYRAPVTTGTPAPQTPSQPALREPAPIGAPGGVSDLAARAAPPVARPGGRSGISPPLMDDATADEDSDSLDLNQDEHPKFVNQAPKIVPNENETESPKAESPYTGLTISPNDMEQKIGSTTKAFPGSNAASVSADPSPRSLAGVSDASEPAPLSRADDATHKLEDGAPAKSAAAKSKVDLDMADDEDDDEDDEDDKPLTLPLDDSATSARKPVQPEKPVQLPAEKAAEEKPAKELEKPTTPAPMKGFRGFCPVILKDERKLVEARAHIRAEYRGKTYTFSSVEAREAFEENPRKYVPAGDGQDVVRHASGETDVEGTLEHAAWYRGRLYLFASADSRREFVETPSKFMVND